MAFRLDSIQIIYGIFFVCLFYPVTGNTKDSVPFKLTYKQVDSTKLELTVYPSIKKVDKDPAIVFFFGGGWIRGSIKQFAPHAQYFAQRGLTGILVDYRVSSRNHTTPFDAVEDARDALKFILQNSDKLNIDKNNIVVSGGSAGGHLALMSTFVSKEIMNFRPKAMVLFNPVIDTGPNGYGYERLGKDYKKISPIDNIPLNPPPCILFYGTKDQFISVRQANFFCSLLKAKGGLCKLQLYEGQKHGFFNYQKRNYFIATIRDTDQFLRKEGIIKGKDNIEQWLQTRNY